MPNARPETSLHSLSFLKPNVPTRDDASLQAILIFSGIGLLLSLLAIICGSGFEVGVF